MTAKIAATIATACLVGAIVFYACERRSHRETVDVLIDINGEQDRWIAKLEGRITQLDRELDRLNRDTGRGAVGGQE